MKLDGDLSDWDGQPYMAQTAFRPCDKVGGAPCKAPFAKLGETGSSVWCT